MRGAEQAAGDRRGIGSVLGASAAGARDGPGIAELLHAIRTHLDMDVAFVSEFRDGKRLFKYVDTEDASGPVQAGTGDPLEDTYCQRVVDGRLPELIPDTAAVPGARALPVTAALPVGAHLSVPITLSDGTRYGTFCCFSSQPDPSLTERDLAMMRVFAELAGHRVEAEERERREREAVRDRLRGALSGDVLTTVFQPILELSRGTASGYEALSRFSAPPERSPDVWFADAQGAGLEVDLDLVAIAGALRAVPSIPLGSYLAINVTPGTVTSGRLEAALSGANPGGTVLEITEHAVVQNYDELAAALAPLRTAGFRISVDDAGAGYASLHHILRVQPEMIKLDMSLTRGIDAHTGRRALVSAMVTFGAATGATIVAEGVETQDELTTLMDVGVTHAQGYFLGRPAPLPDESSAAPPP